MILIYSRFFVKVFGKIVQVDVKASKGFAFVEFDNLDSVKTVLTLGKPIKIGKCVFIDVLNVFNIACCIYQEIEY